MLVDSILPTCYRLHTTNIVIHYIVPTCLLLLLTILLTFCRCDLVLSDMLFLSQSAKKTSDKEKKKSNLELFKEELKQ